MSNALKRTLQWILLTVAASAFAAPLRHAVQERTAGARDVQVLLQARSTSVDLNGTSRVYHGLTGLQNDPMAAGVTAIRPDGSTRTYLATDILPRGTVPAGKAGLVYAITPLTTPGMFAATAGWQDADRRAKTAVVFFREAADGTLSNYSVVPAPGARAIAAGPNDTAVVATTDVAIVNAGGNVLATWGRFETPSTVRLHQIGRETVAVYDPATQRVDAIAMAADGERLTLTNLWTIPVGDTSDSGATEVFPVIGFAATRDGVVTVVRPVMVNDRARTLVTRYTAKGRQASWSSDHFWRAALVSTGEIRGMVPGPTLWEERVTPAE